MFEETYYLTKVDDKHRRTYAIKKGPIGPMIKTQSHPQSSQIERRLTTLEGHLSSSSI